VPDDQFETFVRCSITLLLFLITVLLYQTCLKNFIIRHRLLKEPLAKQSEAVKPITYYLDNGVPEPIRLLY
jgi:hypothetical protein